MGGLPPKTAPNQFRFPLAKISLFHRLVALLRVVEYEMGDRQIMVHLGWPMSSWWERLSIGVMVFNLMKLPRLFPGFDFEIHYEKRAGLDEESRRKKPGKIRQTCLKGEIVESKDNLSDLWYKKLNDQRHPRRRGSS